MIPATGIYDTGIYDTGIYDTGIYDTGLWGVWGDLRAHLGHFCWAT